jgi:hypothetical protein
MENSQLIDNELEYTKHLELTTEMKNQIIVSAKWAKLLSFVGILILVLLVASLHFSIIIVGSIFIMAIYFTILFFSLIMILPSVYYLFNFSNAILKIKNEANMEVYLFAFENLKKLFKLLNIVYKVIYIYLILVFLTLILFIWNQMF